MEDAPDRVLALDIEVPRRWESVLNNAIGSGAQRRPNAEVGDWSGHAGARPELLTRAQVHVNPKGRATHIALLDRIIDRN